MSRFIKIIPPQFLMTIFFALSVFAISALCSIIAWERFFPPNPNRSLDYVYGELFISLYIAMIFIVPANMLYLLIAYGLGTFGLRKLLFYEVISLFSLILTIVASHVAIRTVLRAA